MFNIDGMMALLMSLSIFATPSPVVESIDINRLLTKTELTSLVYAAADTHNVSRQEMLRVVLCEAEKTKVDGEIRYVADGQSHHILSYGREESYGLAMWHLPAGNLAQNGELITEEIAKDPIRALDEMAWYFLQGRQSLWSCF